MQPGTFLKMFIFLLANFHLQLFPQIVDGVCWPNNDNRQLVDVPAIGRIVTIHNGAKTRWGTATILNTGLLISARHVWADIESVNLEDYAYVEFNIKKENGVEIVDPEDIYLIDVPTLRIWSDAAEQDIITFEVYPNEITGIFPRTKQND
ncbi:MAG: hypothetical protein IT279_11835, partial [Ignavibacteriaceae bacterium]|nr:hypothetical protein [Ignavibacteriaceae bacterium]